MDRELAWVLSEKYGGNASAPGFEEDERRLALGEPAAYVIGFQPFLGLKIWLDSKPLIPRPETEWWTEQLLASLPISPFEPAPPIEERAQCDGASQSKFLVGNYAAPKAVPPARAPNPFARAPLSFLDLCAGSGAIGCAALSRLPNARVYFGESEKRHEETIRRNVRENGLDAERADIRIGDLFTPFEDLTFDVIAANPPYIPQNRSLEKSVSDYEPHEALYAGEDGLALMRRIASELPKRLSPGGIAWIECDTGHADAARALFEKAGLPAAVIPDQYGEPRVIEVSSRQ